MTREEIITRVLAIVGEIAGAYRSPADAGPDTPLGEDGYWLDSVGMLEIIVACEEAFGTQFDTETDVNREALRTVGTLAEMIQAKLKG